MCTRARLGQTVSLLISLALSARLSFFLSLSLSRVGSLSLLNDDDKKLSSISIYLYTRLWLAGLPAVGRTCSHHVGNSCPGIPVQASCHFESVPASVLERVLCFGRVQECRDVV